MKNYSKENRRNLLKSASLTANPLEMMRDANAINLNLDEPIYRIFSLDRFIEMLKSQKNTLVRPSMWNDPFENILFNHTYRDRVGKVIDMSSIRDSWYGQCWTDKQEECDGLWRVYGQNGFTRCVRVKTTVRKIFEPLYAELPEHEWQFFIGKVDYSSEDEIINLIENFTQLLATDLTNTNQMQLLLTKRKAFSYESEVRILYCAGVNKDNHNTIYQYPIDIDTTFEEVILYPWCPDRMVKNYADNIHNAGYHNLVTKSLLYTPPAITTTIV